MGGIEDNSVVCPFDKLLDPIVYAAVIAPEDSTDTGVVVRFHHPLECCFEELLVCRPANKETLSQAGRVDGCDGCDSQPVFGLRNETTTAARISTVNRCACNAP